jgi:hypothetical protein
MEIECEKQHISFERKLTSTYIPKVEPQVPKLVKKKFTKDLEVLTKFAQELNHIELPKHKIFLTQFYQD